MTGGRPGATADSEQWVRGAHEGGLSRGGFWEGNRVYSSGGLPNPPCNGGVIYTTTQGRESYQ